MQVVELQGTLDDLVDPLVALVETNGVKKEVRLEMNDRIPEVGEYVIIHAGFAIRTLTEKEALENLELMRQMALALEKEGRLPG